MRRRRRTRTASESEADIPPALARARAVAHLMDAQFSVGGFRFGVDALVGLAPVAGDLVVGLIGGMVMLQAADELGLSWWVKTRILGYTVLDLVVGAVPVLGDAIDFVYRSNLKSLALIERAWAKKRG
ncbi:DUF4112 domain-containing protein [Marinicauda salina]|uniref:DUF4112 domain-containing protein n=1 Tax=Marinicauda salina TaxID=2135793 RepID=A0A2U2BQS5_9PROT|nr:DUF4112 domain-containing protein [Marinicauda salina]PWE16367.1 DUF4112 domain-containing protein [Marinicauda salina]